MPGCKYSRDGTKWFSRKDHLVRHMKTHEGTTKHQINKPYTTPLSLVGDRREKSVKLPHGREDTDTNHQADAKDNGQQRVISQAIGDRNEAELILSENDASAKSQKSDDQKSTTRACWLVPFTRNPLFVGRSSTLIQLESMLFEDRFHTVAIVGLGGVGKSQIALEFAYRVRDKYPECSVFWAPATSIESLEQAYQVIGRQLRIPECEERRADVKKLVQHHLSQESAGQWLLIFDNADDIDMWINANHTAKPPRLIDHLPRSSRGSVMFTTRSQKAGVKLASYNLIKVTEIDEHTGSQLLRGFLPNQDISNDDPTTLELLRQLTFLPLAIVQASAFIIENQITLLEYLSLLQDNEQNVIELLSEDFEDQWRYRNTMNPVATTWLISFEQIRRRDPLAAEYLSFMACLYPTDVPQSLLPAAQSKIQVANAIGTLCAYSFIVKRADHSFNLHRLVHLGTRNWLRMRGSLKEWTAKVTTRLANVFPTNDFRNRSIWRAYLPHAQYILESDLLPVHDTARLLLLEKFGLCLLSDGRYIEAENPFLQVMEVRIKLQGQTHPDTLASIANLASTLWNQGRWNEAEELFTQEMTTRMDVLGQDHPDTLASVANLASTFWNQGRWEKAEELELQVLERQKRLLGSEHLDTLASMANLASTFCSQGRWKAAEELEVQVVDTQRSVLGEEHPDTLISTSNLALTYQNQGRWKQAEQLFTQVIKASQRVLGREHPDTLTSINNLAWTYQNQKQWKEAEELLMQVIRGREGILGQSHPSTLKSISNLALTLWNQGRLREAEELEIQVLEIRKKVLGQEHPDTLASMASLASTYRSQGQERWKKAEDLEMQMVEISCRVLGQEHRDTLTSMSNLASTLWNQGRLREAEELEMQVLETRERSLGQDHPDTLISMNNLAFTWKSQGRDDEAFVLMKKCVQLRKRTLGFDFPDTKSSVDALHEWERQIVD